MFHTGFFVCRHLCQMVEEEGHPKKNDQMFKTIGQVTLERDFLQDFFRQNGKAIQSVDLDNEIDFFIRFKGCLWKI